MRVEPDGKVPCDLAAFGECPGYEEQMEGRGFVGKSGKQLWADMKRFCGLTRDDFYVSNIVKNGQAKNREPKPAEIAEAMPEVLDELERVNPRVIVAAGAVATKAFLGPVKMSDVHGIPHNTDICGRTYTVMPIYHPAAGLHNKGFLSAFAYDLDHFAAFRANRIKPWAPASRPARAEWLLRPPSPKFGASASVVAVDTEGWKENPWGLSFSFDGDTGFVIPITPHKGASPDALRWFAKWLADKVVVGHSLLHDIPVLRAMGVSLLSHHTSPLRVPVFHDTQVLAYHDMMRTGSGVLESESQNLGTLAYRECGLRLGELTDIGGVDLDEQIIPYTDQVMEYAGADPCATWRLFQLYKSRGLTEYRPYQIDMGQIPLIEQMMACGIPFDADATVDYYATVLDKLADVTESLKKKAARYGNRDFNPGSHPQVREIITRKIGLRIRKRTKGGLASTNEKALADYQDNPFVQELQVHRELSKLRGTYILPLLEELQ